MMERFMPVPISFFGHRKTKRIKKTYPSLYRAVIYDLWHLWSICNFYYQDGVLKMSAEEIEELVDWSGESGQFVEILTCHKFIDKKSDEEYHMHNWYKRNPMFDPEKKGKVSKTKQKGGYAKGFKEQLQRLNDNGVELDDCPWLYQHEEGWMGVEYKGNVLPEKMDLGYKVFYSRTDFYNNNSTPDDKEKNNKLIKKHTKRCKKCQALCVSSTPLCFECSGI